MNNAAEAHRMHKFFRDNRGRVRMKARDEIEPKSVTLMRIVLSRQTFKELLKEYQSHVGQAKSGWLKICELAGKPVKAKWLAQHINKFGEAKLNLQAGNLEAELINKSKWASRGVDNGIRAKALANRQARLEKAVNIALEKIFNGR